MIRSRLCPSVFSIIAFSLFLAMIFSGVLYAGIGDWKNFLSMKDVRSVTVANSAVWAATSGGAFRFSFSDSSFSKFTNSNGLSTNDITSVAEDGNGGIWFGQANGSIDIYSPVSGSWRSIRDIANSLKSQKRINALYSSGDTMYVASPFGISVFSLSRFEFGDTYSNFASLTQPSVSALRAFRNRIFAVTNGGVVISKPGATNLAAPESWTLFPSNPAQPVDLAILRDTVFLSSSTGLYFFTGEQWVQSQFVTQTSGAMSVDNGDLYLIQGNRVAVLSGTSSIRFIGNLLPAAPTSLSAGGGFVAAGSADRGIIYSPHTGAAWLTTMPNSPSSNYFSSIAVDDLGILWCASAGSKGSGFYSFNGKMWTNYSTATDTNLKSNDFYRVAIGLNNSKWIASWGGGIALYNSEGKFVRMFNNTYPGLCGADNPWYVVPTGMVRDRSDNMWVSLFNPLDSKVLWKMSSDSVWTSVAAPSIDNVKDMLGLLIDRNGTKWLTNAIPGFTTSSSRLYYYNELVNVSGSDDRWGNIGPTDGLSSTTVYALALDKDGDVWVGTGSGITIIGEPRYPSTRVRRVQLGVVREETINAIAVDPLNNKWIATKLGVFVLSPDGTSLLQQYSVETTGGKLVDNNVIALCIDDKEGIAYFGTDKGLSSLEIPPIGTVEEFKGLTVYPNPFYLPAASPVTISGLVDDALIKIISVDGVLIRSFHAQGGGRAFWDGIDEQGKPVGSGIYLVIASGSSSENIALGKIAVLRR